MSRDKQIEEMARIIANANGNEQDAAYYIPDATDLYNAGYRKASEVAEEIFGEIEQKVKTTLTIHLEEINKEHIIDTPLYDRHSGIVFALKGMGDFIAELKKKYIGEDTNVPTNTEGE